MPATRRRPRPSAPPTSRWVEYADTGQDEKNLATKIAELFAAGTRLVWVVRLVGPRRVEVHEPGKEMRLAHPGEELVAAGILRNPVLVEALYDRRAAHEATLRNLLQRRGYRDLDDVRAQGREEAREEAREEGRADGLRFAVHGLCEAFGIDLGAEREAVLGKMSAAELEALQQRLLRDRRWS
jgi:hypothetical protein